MVPFMCQTMFTIVLTFILLTSCLAQEVTETNTLSDGNTTTRPTDVPIQDFITTEDKIFSSNIASVEEEHAEPTTERPVEPSESQGNPLSIEIIAGIAGGAVLTLLVLAGIFVVILRRSCQKAPQPMYDPDNFESFRLMRSSANLLAISEPPMPIEGRARPRAGSLQLAQPPQNIHDFKHSVMETYKKINGLEKMGCLPEYMELIEGPDGVYLELTVEYDITPEVEEYIPYAERQEEYEKSLNQKKNRRS